jgi:hypothetical protein
MPHPLCLSLTAGSLMLAGCAAPAAMSTTSFPPVEVAAAAVAAVEPLPVAEKVPSFQVDPAFRTGVERMRSGDGGDWLWGNQDGHDWALLGVELTNGGTKDVWFVRLAQTNTDEDSQAPRIQEFRVPAAVGAIRRGTRFTAPADVILVEVFDISGELVQLEQRLIPSGAGRTSIEELGRALAGEADAPSRGEQVDLGSHPLVSLMVAMRNVTRATPIRPIRDAARAAVIREPSILSIILSGFRINVRADFSNAEELPGPWMPGVGGLPQFLAQSPLLVAGTNVTEARVVVGPNDPPYHLTAGMLLMEAAHPKKPGNRLSVRVLAASE